MLPVKSPKSPLYRYLRSGANMLLVGRRRGDAATPRSEEQAACRVRLRLKRKSKGGFIELIPLLQVAWSNSGTGERVGAGLSMLPVKSPKSPLYRYLRS